MKISVIIPSRGRPQELIAALHSLHNTESGSNQVAYGVVCDSDDQETIGTCKLLQTKMPLSYYVQERNPSLGGMVNKMAEFMPADVYCSLIDDCLCITKSWDRIIADAVTENPKGVWWWTPLEDAQPYLLAIVSEQWREAAGQIFTDYFPYWYDDIWLLALWILATEGPAMYLPITVIDCPKATHRMRDLRFWHNFYIEMHGMRAAHAKRIAAKLKFPMSRIHGAAIGHPDLSITDALAKRLSVTPPEFESQMDHIEDSQGDKGAPTPEYLKAKARAELLLKQKAFLTGALPMLDATAKLFEEAA